MTRHFGWEGFAFGFGSRAWGFRAGRGRRRQWFEAGDMKYVILKLLRDKPRHGYEVMKELEDRLHGLRRRGSQAGRGDPGQGGRGDRGPRELVALAELLERAGDVHAGHLLAPRQLEVGVVQWLGGPVRGVCGPSDNFVGKGRVL